MKEKRTEQAYLDALQCKVDLDTIGRMSGGKVRCIDRCYDIQTIRRGFQAYFSKTISKSYFYYWCILYAKLIRETYPLKSRKDIAYDEIATCLREVTEDEKPIMEILAEIEIHNEVLEDKRAPEYEIASDGERFYVNLEETDMVDFVCIYHKKKTFLLLRGVDDLVTDGADILGNEIYSYGVSRVVFEAICKSLGEMGYTQEKDFEEMKNEDE